MKISIELELLQKLSRESSQLAQYALCESKHDPDMDYFCKKVLNTIEEVRHHVTKNMETHV